MRRHPPRNCTVSFGRSINHCMYRLQRSEDTLPAGVGCCVNSMQSHMSGGHRQACLRVSMFLEWQPCIHSLSRGECVASSQHFAMEPVVWTKTWCTSHIGPYGGHWKLNHVKFDHPRRGQVTEVWHKAVAENDHICTRGRGDKTETQGSGGARSHRLTQSTAPMKRSKQWAKPGNSKDKTAQRKKPAAASKVGGAKKHPSKDKR